tara:strand:- start:1364 stop:2128 length:765 start_codon:yes stop_codon:yes gene_type:complete
MYKNTINVNILNQKILIKEPSFFIFKSFIKNLINTDNVTEAFDNLIQSVYTGKLNYYQKIILLLNLRGLIFGNNIEFEYKDKRAIIDVDRVINCYDNQYKKVVYEYKGNIYTFDYGDNLDFQENKINFVADSLLKINDTEINCNLNDKVNMLPAFNFIHIFDKIMLELYSKEFYINMADTTITPINIIHFLKTIFQTDASNLYEMEYTLRKYLNLNTDDLKSLSLPECKILLNCYISDQKKQEQRSNQQLKDSN